MYSGEFVSFFVVNKQWFKSVSSLTDWIKIYWQRAKKQKVYYSLKIWTKSCLGASVKDPSWKYEFDDKKYSFLFWNCSVKQKLYLLYKNESFSSLPAICSKIPCQFHVKYLLADTNSLFYKLSLATWAKGLGRGWRHVSLFMQIQSR